jgi:hypothetical protein
MPLSKLIEKTARHRMTPTFMVIGGQRCGCRVLFNALAQHPRIKAGPGDTGFFDQPAQFGKGTDWYASHFPVAIGKKARSGFQQVGECAPTYLLSPAAPQRLSKLYPQTKLIVLLRDPVARAWAHYQRARQGGIEDRDFADAIKEEQQWWGDERQKLIVNPTHESEDVRTRAYLHGGCYAALLKRWFEFMPRVRYHIVKTESLINDQKRTLDRAAAFLDIGEFEGWKPVMPKREPYPLNPDEVKAQLTEFYTPHNLALSELLKMKFEWA